MKTWQAPLTVAIVGIIGGTLTGEPAASLLFIGLALLGYALNKKAN